MANGNCSNCGDCCTTFCQNHVTPDCVCCKGRQCGKPRPSTSYSAGQFLAVNSANELVQFNPQAEDDDLETSKHFIGISEITVNYDENLNPTNVFTNYILNNLCQKARYCYYVCGVWCVAQLQAWENYSAEDLAKAVQALHYGRITRAGDNGEFMLYGTGGGSN